MNHSRQTLAIGGAIVLAVILGFVAGDALLPFFTWGGQMFIRLLKMVIVPLVFASIVSGLMSAGSKGNLGWLGLKTMAWYMSTTLMAILMAMLMFNLLGPGIGAAPPDAVMPVVKPATEATIPAILLRMVPDNIVDAMARTDTLAIIFFALLLGVAANRLPENDRNRVEGGFRMLLEIMLTITGWVIRLAPVGIFCLVGGAVANLGMELFSGLVMYFITVVVSLGAHSLLVLPIMIRVIGGVSPWRFGSAMGPALLMAFSTSSSNATLPVTLSCAEERAGISNRITSFVIPLGATINMDGTALYECGVALFIAQYYGLDLGLGQQVVLVFTCLMTSIAVAGIPMASIALIPVILAAVGLPESGIALVIVLDRVLDMCRTAVNVWSDACGAAVVAATEGESFPCRITRRPA